ncbi:MAG: GldG family protein [Syntrophobacteraceae bacterium]
MAQKSTRGRKLVYGSNTVISTIIFIAILAFVALIAQRHPWRVDLTESGSFSLSEQTRNIVKAIDKPVAVKGFFSTGAPEQLQGLAKAKDLLETYRYQNNNISFEFIDPDLQPEIARQYEIKTYGTLVIEGYDKKQVVSTADEENFTNALLKLTRKEQKKIYFLTGHGEHSVKASDKDGYSAAKTALESNYYAVAEFNLLQQPDVPADAAAVVIAGPVKPMGEHEREALKAYIERGGKVLVMVDPLIDTGLEDFLKGYGIEIGDDVVVDRLSRLFGASERIPVVVEYGEHKITNGFSLPTFFPDARSVAARVESPPEGVQLSVLAATSPNAWAERDLEMLKGGQAAFEQGKDLPGPVPLVVAANIAAKGEKDHAGEHRHGAGEHDHRKGSGDGVVIVAGDSDFVANTYFSLYGNGDFFLNAVNFLADEANLITIEARHGKNKPVLLTRGQAQAVFWIVLVLVPLAVLVAGLAVYRIRRAQR